MEKKAGRNRKTRIKTNKTSISREFSAGGVVFKKWKVESGKWKTFWLVTKSAPSKLVPEGFWRLPKGWLDDKDNGKNPGRLGSGEERANEDQLKKAAIKEVKEEGGVEAKIISKILTDRFFFTFSGKRILKFVTYYLMERTRELQEGPGFETQEIAWLAYKEARKKLKHSGEKKVLDKAREKLEQGIQENLV